MVFSKVEYLKYYLKNQEKVENKLKEIFEKFPVLVFFMKNEELE